LDDVIGLGILALMQGLMNSPTMNDRMANPYIPWVPLGILISGGFLYFIIRRLQATSTLPRFGMSNLVKSLSTRLINLADGTTKEVVLIVGGILLLCWATQTFFGISMALVAFGAGLALREHHQKPAFAPVLQDFSAFARVIIPIFFIGIGMQLNLVQFNPFIPAQRELLFVAMALIVIAVASKACAGWAVRDRSINSALIGMGMVPRGEVGLIFVTVGLSTGTLDAAWANILIVVVIVSTMIAPVLIKATIKRQSSLRGL
jgi:Kef-type K+ transport system membrane component KefB